MDHLPWHLPALEVYLRLMRKDSSDWSASQMESSSRTTSCKLVLSRNSDRIWVESQFTMETKLTFSSLVSCLCLLVLVISLIVSFCYLILPVSLIVLIAPSSSLTELNIQARPVEPLVEAGAQVQQYINVEAVEDFKDRPQLVIQFIASGLQQRLNLHFPLTLNKFFEPTTMNAETFFSRWKNLNK